MSSTVASVQSYVVSGAHWGSAFVYAQRFDAGGEKIGDPIQLTGPQAWAYANPTTSLSNGKFVISYSYAETSSSPTTIPYRQHAVLAEIDADGVAFTVRDIASNSIGETNGVEVKALSDGTYAYILRTTDFSGSETTFVRTLGFVDGSGQARETRINEDHASPFDGNTPGYHPGDPTIQLRADGKFSVSYNVTYGTGILSPPGQPQPEPDPSAMQRTVSVYDAEGHLKMTRSVDFGQTIKENFFDADSGAKIGARTTFKDGSHVDTQFGITGRYYVEQAVSVDSDGHVTERARYYGDEKHTLAFNEKFFADGTTEVRNFDTLGREIVHQVGDLRGEHDVTQTTYAGDGADPVKVVLTHYGPANTRQFTDTTKADGTHLQQSLAAGVTLTSHAEVADTFVGFAKGSDTFVFGPDFGKDTVKGFVAGSGVHHDVLQFDETLLTSASDLASHVRQVGGDALISFDDGSSVLLKNVAANALTADNVHILHHEGLWA